MREDAGVPGAQGEERLQPLRQRDEPDLQNPARTGVSCFHLLRAQSSRSTDRSVGHRTPQQVLQIGGTKASPR